MQGTDLTSCQYCMILMQQLMHIPHRQQHRRHQWLIDRGLETVFLEDRYVAFDPGDMG